MVARYLPEAWVIGQALGKRDSPAFEEKSFLRQFSARPTTFVISILSNGTHPVRWPVAAGVPLGKTYPENPQDAYAQRALICGVSFSTSRSLRMSKTYKQIRFDFGTSAACGN